MLDAPADTWYLWIGIATASTLGFGVAVAFPSTAPPDATRAAETVDRVATSQYDATGEAPLAADAIKLGPHRIALRNDGGTAHAAFTYGPVTPVSTSLNSSLAAVLSGTPPRTAFENQTAFREAVATAQNRSREWRPADGNLIVRHVSWGDIDVTLVGV